MDKKRFSVNLVANILSYFVSAVLSFFLTPFLVNHLGTELYGFYGIANNTVNYITIIAIALNSMASKYITVEMVRGNQGKANRYFSSVFFSNIILCLILTPILVFFVLYLQLFLNVSSEYLTDVQILFLLVFLAMIVRFLTSVFGTAVYATNRMDYRAYLDFGKTGLRLIFFVLLFTIFRPSIIYLGFVLLLLEIFNSVTQIFFSKRLTPELKIRRSDFDKDLIKQTLRVGVWNSLNQLGDLLLSSSDLLVANILIGELASGNISIIKTVPVLISGIITAINVVFLPRITHLYGENRTEEMIKDVNRSQLLMGTLITPIVVLFSISGKAFFSLWVPNNDATLLSLLSCIEVSRMAVVAVTWPVSNLNIVMDKVKVPSIAVIISGLLNVFSMFLLIRFTQLGIYAIPITTLVIAGIFYGVFIPIYASRILKVSTAFFFKPILKMLMLVIVLLLVYVPLFRFLSLSTWLHYATFAGIGGVISLVISAVIMIGPRKSVSLLRRGVKR